jgi:hypothetical protein
VPPRNIPITHDFSGLAHLEEHAVSFDRGEVPNSLDNAAPMGCRSCESENRKKFVGEIGIRSPGLKNIDQPIVFIFPELSVCLDCGTAEFVVPEAELSQLATGEATSWLRSH